ncbi:MAG: protease HtpX [Proteobacteria bacterium]|nr:protease HtpX [Pseudomonadota bacterium]
MVWMKRIFLFMMVNILVMLSVTVIAKLLGVDRMAMAGGTLNLGSLAIYSLVWGMVGSFVSLALSRIMAKWMMGVQIIDPSTSNHELRDLVSTVHRLADQAGIPHPEVGIYQGADVNAFATGPTKARSLVAVSSGLLNVMTKQERDGVLAHEVAHIANGDMVTMTLVQGVVNAFVLFFARIVGWAASQALKSDRDERGSPMVEFAVTMVCQILFSILGMMVVAAFSRYREFRADEGSAKLAGKQNMIAALQRLNALHGRPTESQHPDGDRALAAFKISGGKMGGFMALISTHPPLEDRIARLQGRM